MSEYRLHDLLLVPNLLSGARLPLAALFPLCATRPSCALGLLGAAGVTDMLDGFVARKLGQATPVGALVDGVSDKVFAVSVLGTMIGARLLSPATALLLATRELLELPLALRILFSPKARLLERERASNELGKLATTLQFASIASVLARAPGRKVLVLATAVVGAAAAASYWIREVRAMRRASARALLANDALVHLAPGPSAPGRDQVRHRLRVAAGV